MEIELRGITKRFGDVIANDDVNLTVRAGEVLGLLGENGAGKSTLMNVLSGLYSPTSGSILIDGNTVSFAGPGDAIRAGIGMVHQHFMLVPVFSVAENVVLGVEPTGKLDFLDLKKAYAQVAEINNTYGLKLDPSEIIENLPVGIQQRVEIIKVLFREADVIIFDEPTAVLTPQEVTEFFEIVKSLRDAGKGIVFITHKLHEILDISDRISVLRGGKIVGSGDPKTATELELAEMMVGRPVDFRVAKAPFTPGPVLLNVKNLTVLHENDDIAVDAVNFAVRSGEILGIAGVQGNGQTLLVEALTGLKNVAGGEIIFQGEDITRKSPREHHKLGFAHIPEDRQRTGIIANFSVAENMVLDTYYDDRFSTGLQMNWPAIRQTSAELVTRYDVRTPSVFTPASDLSGGNQQKLVVARELSRETKLVIAAQPTRGLDVGSIEFIHKRMVDARDSGDGLLIISSELDEIIALSDRILVMFKGKFVAEFGPGAQAIDKNAIGLAMAGATAEAAA